MCISHSIGRLLRKNSFASTSAAIAARVFSGECSSIAPRNRHWGIHRNKCHAAGDHLGTVYGVGGDQITAGPAEISGSRGRGTGVVTGSIVRGGSQFEAMRLSILDRILDNVPLSIVEHKRCKSLLQRIQGLVLRAKCFRMKVPPARQGENSGNCDPLYLLRLSLRYAGPIAPQSALVQQCPCEGAGNPPQAITRPRRQSPVLRQKAGNWFACAGV